MTMVDWVIDLARIADGRDKATIGDAMGWPKVTPSLRKILSAPEDDDTYSRLEVQAMAQAMDELSKLDEEAYRQVISWLRHERAGDEQSLVRGIKWLGERVDGICR